MMGVKGIFDTTPITAVIGVDTDAETISFYVKIEDRKEVQQVVSYHCAPFSEAFYQVLDKSIKNYQQRNPSVSLSKVSIILPDYVFLMDTLRVPALGRKAMEHSLEVSIGAIYKNKKDLRYRTYPLAQNKQFATFGIVGIRKDILSKLEAICTANQIRMQNVTFVANAMACGAMTLNPRLKNGTFLLLDIKENTARFSFVNKGRVIGTYRLPFGNAMLSKSHLVSEDLLFDHTTGELLVLNATEKAKAKHLTMMGEEAFTDPEEMTKPEAARKLPKYMQRELPTDREGFAYENFRIFVKWTLELLANNTEITSLGVIDTVYVNMPKEYDFLFSRLNAEEKENGVVFAPLLTGNGYSEFVGNARQLELFGGFQLKQFGKNNLF